MGMPLKRIFHRLRSAASRAAVGAGWVLFAAAA